MGAEKKFPSVIFIHGVLREQATAPLAYIRTNGTAWSSQYYFSVSMQRYRLVAEHALEG